MIDNWPCVLILRELLAGEDDPVAQSVEHLTFNQVVAGSIPARISGPVAQWQSGGLSGTHKHVCRLTSPAARAGDGRLPLLMGMTQVRVLPPVSTGVAQGQSAFRRSQTCPCGPLASRGGNRAGRAERS